MRVVILGNGKWEEADVFLSLIRKRDFFVACNGAYEKARRIGLLPQAIIGDLDSVKKMEVWNSGAEIFAYPREKDETDGELALQFALGKRPTEILWYAALGNRWDQTLANFFLLMKAAMKRVPVKLIQGRSCIHLVLKGVTLKGKRGDRVSLLPLSSGVRGIVTKGLRYPLKHESLFQGSTRGVSNEMIASKSSVRIKQGWLLVFHERGLGLA